MRTNVDLRTRIEFPRSTYHNLEEDKLFIDLHYGGSTLTKSLLKHNNLLVIKMNDIFNRKEPKISLHGLQKHQRSHNERQ